MYDPGATDCGMLQRGPVGGGAAGEARAEGRSGCEVEVLVAGAGEAAVDATLNFSPCPQRRRCNTTSAPAICPAPEGKGSLRAGAEVVLEGALSL